jgi:pyrroline-5-carboxylate reductase
MIEHGDVIVAPEELKKLCFIGGGGITKSIIIGLDRSGFDLSGITVVDRNAEKLEKFSALGCRVILNDDGMPDIVSILRNDAIIIAVKPESFKEACSILFANGRVQLHNQVVISVMASVKIREIRKELGGHPLVVRAMPNICVEVCCGVTKIAVDDDSADFYFPVSGLFGRVGMVV